MAVLGRHEVGGGLGEKQIRATVQIPVLRGMPETPATRVVTVMISCGDISLALKPKEITKYSCDIEVLNKRLMNLMAKDFRI